MKKIFLLSSFFVLYVSSSVIGATAELKNDQLDMLLSNCLDPYDSFNTEKTTYCIAIIDTIDRLCQFEYWPACLDSRYWVGTEQ